MGFSTEVHISNDAWHIMRENPGEFCDRITEGMNARCIDSYGVQNYVNYLKVAPSHHADDPRLYLSWRGAFVDMSEWGCKRDYPRLADTEYLIKFMEENIKQAQYQLTSLKKYIKALKEDKK